MIDFLYFGEANVYQEHLESFLAVAEELQLKGLMGSGAEEEAKELHKPPVQKKTKKPVKRRSSTKQEFTVESKESSATPEGTVAVTDYTVAADLQDLDDKIKSMMMFSENKTKDGKERARICTICHKEGQMRDIQRHIEANHITGVSHTCDICGITTRTNERYSKTYRSPPHHWSLP